MTAAKSPKAEKAAKKEKSVAPKEAKGEAHAKPEAKAAPTRPKVAPPTWEGPPALVVIAGGTALIGSRLNLKDGKTIVGRAPDADLTILDGSMSRQHAQFVMGEDGKVAIFDLGSRHGVFVNDKKVGAAELSDGDYVRLGSVVFKFRTAVKSPRAPDAPPKTGTIPPEA